ncbi:hypothetical protein [Patiriisocius sp. Uisw_017]|jgi:hypothetical protein|uniref:hypothetical protein n=1 Tax=Patiriisocius sp. Uisw_017 TaxID=3230968 RepID=UPI0039EA3903
MKKKSVIILTVVSGLIILAIFIIFQSRISHYFTTKDFIYWSNNTEITLNDFQGKVNKNSNSKISWWHGLTLTAEGNKVQNAKVSAVFDKSKSWVRDTTDYKNQLKLQKLRFDLYESFARKFNKKIDEIRFKQNVKYQDLEKIGDEIYAELGLQDDAVFDYEDEMTTQERIKTWRPIVDSLLNGG